ncbi:nitrilase-related carbon-nitrogen hydrolase [Mycolicibacterium brumae]|uniref:Carbon-nitrogen hydrolase n=1 Tax=Mycolicibacterium brumae TaxID=85968 RepID=A0A2G5P6N7_9MYCO|nr:nitrilase-related carbon-nitrogen hydrolase [Mycolicibacterium brumae]MCV7194315.1 carbon-nitrogen hydrolase [Mycolicibacterium brumae]PIB73936.1 carbon-nitrogen hydrolase [Mycolicibacterium brumae]RWA20253.1 hypothetical protein MBRU_15405 [Mycolicibacterium brumae DSM 44177]UWW09668.1 carbon-nitrogen hydrolase [Mycolicibacterium brumae]
MVSTTKADSRAEQSARGTAIRIAVAQRIPPQDDDVSPIQDLVTTAVQASGAELLVVPELFPIGVRQHYADLKTLAESAERWAELVGAVATTAHMAIVAGYPELAADGSVYDSVMFVDEFGRMRANYRKLHLFGDELPAFTPGNAPPPVFDWHGWRVGLAICYDIEFPETGRMLADQGADLVCVPAGNPVGYREVPTVLVPARACENQMFVAYANYCDFDGTADYDGHSIVVGPNGAILAEADSTTAQILWAELNPAALGVARSKNSHLTDRRFRIYMAGAPRYYIDADSDTTDARRAAAIESQASSSLAQP